MGKTGGRLMSTFSVLIIVMMCGLVWSSGAPANAQATGSIDVRVNADSDDAEENMFGGVSAVVSTDLDMMFDRFGSGQNNVMVGLRFTGVAIPRNANITNAYVEFRVDEVSDIPTSLRLRGQATDHAATFTHCIFPTCFDLTNRPTTAAAVNWVPDPWLTTFTFERTTDIRAIIQEIVSRSGWMSGNALAILIDGAGERTAHSFEGPDGLLGAPRLHVEWQNPGHVELFKLTNGVENHTMAWSFTLTGHGVDESDSTPPTRVDFDGANLRPGEEYTLCETGIPAGWTRAWQVDTNGDGVPDTIIPIVAGVNDDPVDPIVGFSRVYDPNFVPPPDTFTNDTRCVNFVVEPDETLAFQIDNRFPGGDPRTKGFWKNWNTCTNGNQAQTAANNGGPDEGWFILDDLLNEPGHTIGTLELGDGDCENAVNILDKRDLSGKKRANDAAYNLAAQLLAAQLNLSVGAETCQAAVDAVNAGQTLLQGIGFDGTGSNYLRPKKDGMLYHDANGLAATLDLYNSGILCQ